MNAIRIKYDSTVFTPAGLRSVEVTAYAERISAKRCKVLEVTHFDGEEVRAFMSRTGANRQKFYGVGAAEREEGKTKNLSACEII